MAKLTEAAMKELFVELTAAMPDENKFNEVMINNAEKFSLPLYIKRAFIDVGRNSTINHQIARSTKDKVIECNKENNCSLCINDKEKILGEDVGSAAYNLYEYIYKHDKVKKKYRELFSESYKNTKNDGGFTPLDFAKTCKPEFAEFMTKKFVIPTTQVKSVRSSLKEVKEAVMNAASRSKRSLSNLAKETEPKSMKDEDLTIEELKSKINKLYPPLRHYQYDDSSDQQKNKDSEEYKKQEKEDKAAYDKIYKLEKILEKKTKKPTSFLSRARRSVFGRNGGKTRKHKKTNKRRTYRRK
uniref:Uncharacterized protein n=1 Tax=viral metagenome TaxID=1070528 RepID=A0A6C0D5R1_9ZZZZ